MSNNILVFDRIIDKGTQFYSIYIYIFEMFICIIFNVFIIFNYKRVNKFLYIESKISYYLLRLI